MHNIWDDVDLLEMVKPKLIQKRMNWVGKNREFVELKKKHFKSHLI